MKVGIAGKTSRLAATVQHINGVTDTVYSMEGNNLDSCDVIILDHLPSKDVEAVWNQYSKQAMAYVLDVRNGIRTDIGSIKELCAIKNIPFLSDHSEEAIQEEIEKLLFPSRYEGKLQPAIALISTHRRSGTTAIAKALSEQIAGKTTAHIGIVSLDPYQVETQKAHGITQLYREFEVGGLTASRIKELSEKWNDNLFYISGNTKLESSRSMHPIALEQIYLQIQSAFDLTVFVVSPYWDNAMVLVALKNIQRKYLVATSHRDEMKEFYAFLPQLWHQYEMDLRNHSFIFNFDGLGTEARSNVSNQLSSGCVMQLPYVPGPDPMNKKFTQIGLQKLAQSIVDEYRLPQVTEQKKKTWFGKIAVS